MVSPQLRCCKCGTKFRAGKGALEADDEFAGLLRRLSLERAPEQAARARGRGAGERRRLELCDPRRPTPPLSGLAVLELRSSTARVPASPAQTRLVLGASA